MSQHAASTQLPKITIVTPCFNAAATIQQTIDSIKLQDYPSIEHLAIDGGSTDGTIEILQREGVRFVSEPDRGLSDAFNKGVRLATGDVIGWLNADDVYEPGALRQVGEAFNANPDALWGFGRCRIMGEQGQETRKFVTAYKNFFLKHFSLPLYLTHNFVSSPATFVRRSGFDMVGVLDERFKYSADYDLWLRLAKASEPVFIDADIAHFRMGSGSLSITGFEEQFREHALNARENAAGHHLPVLVNRVLSRVIVLIYRAIRTWRAHKPA